jgi:transglutaminase-like putative cysteine protease
VHRVMTDSLAALGILAVVNTASMSPWTNALVLVSLVVALALPESWQSKPALGHFATIAPLTLFLIEAARFFAGRSLVDVAVEFAAFLQIIRLSTRRGAVHDQQIIVLALLHFVAGTVLGGGLNYGLCFFGFLIVAPGALVLSHLRREVEGNYRQGARDRTGLPVDVPRILRSRRVVGRGFLVATCLLSVPIFLFTASLFVLFPRVGLSLLLLNHPHSGRMVGFSDHVDLGEVGMLRADPSIALRFEVSDLPANPPPRLTLRLRGTAFDQYDGRQWRRTQLDHHPDGLGESIESFPIYRMPDLGNKLLGLPGDRRVTIDLEPIEPPVVFLPPRTVALSVRKPTEALLADPLTLRRGPESEIRYASPDARGLHYDAFLAGEHEVLTETLPTAERSRYLEVPAVLPTRIGELAHRWADGETGTLAKARALQEHLKKDFRYDTNSPSGGAAQPLDDFLFGSKRGHCEFFSTAMAIMLRELEIPSRNVTGFVGGTFNRFGHYYAVREGDAHSWVEAYLDQGNGQMAWVTFDPTPTAGAQPLEETTGTWVYFRDLVEALSQRWNQYVVGYDLRTQARLFEEVSRGYDGLRTKTGADKGTMGRLTRAPVVAGAFVLSGIVLYAAWKRRRGHRKTTKPEDDKVPVDRNIATATALYRALDHALAQQGVGRPAWLPPLKFAEQLTSRQHPLAGDVMELTSTYLAARFGGLLLDDENKRDFERRVKRIRTYVKPPTPPPVPATA